MVVTATEFKTNFGKYLGLIAEEDIFITKNGKIIAKMTNPNISAVDTLSGLLAGKIASDYDSYDIRNERIAKHEVND